MSGEKVLFDFEKAVKEAETPLESEYGIEDFVEKSKERKLYRFNFKIKSRYEWGQGWGNVDVSEVEKFLTEVLDMFKSLGCRIIPGSFSEADTAKFSPDEFLYLHPMEFTGVLSLENAEKVFNLLNKPHNNFTFLNVYVISKVYDWNEMEYITFLNSDLVRPKIKKDILKLKEAHPIWSNEIIAMDLNEKYKLPVTCERTLLGRSSLDLTCRFILNLADGVFDVLETHETEFLNDNQKNEVQM